MMSMSTLWISYTQKTNCPCKRCRIETERIADQAAAIAAEGKPIPDALRRRADIELNGDRLQVRVPLPVRLPGGPADETVTTSIGP